MIFIVIIFYFAFIGFMIASIWKVFTKAGKPGWACIVPIYSTIVMLEIAKKPIWWFLLFFVPIVNIIFAIMMLNGISKNFGKSEGFTAGMLFLPFIFFPILGFGDATYIDAEKGVNEELLDA
jgi:hypothetical protein